MSTKKTRKNGIKYVVDDILNFVGDGLNIVDDVLNITGDGFPVAGDGSESADSIIPIAGDRFFIVDDAPDSIAVEFFISSTIRIYRRRHIHCRRRRVEYRRRRVFLYLAGIAVHRQ